MKYSLSIRQPSALLEQADQIYLDYKDIGGLYQKVEQFPQKEFIIKIPRDVEKIDWSELMAFRAKKYKITLALQDLRVITAAKQHNLRYYWDYPITTYEELTCLVNMGVSYLWVSSMLYFDLENVYSRGIPIRLVANKCRENYLFFETGLTGTYIRPEDVPAYEKYVDTIDFYGDTEKESVLFDIYKKGEWKGNLNLLLTGYGLNVDNRVFPQEFAQIRMQCRQNCMRTGKCHFCGTAANYSRTLDRVRKDWIEGKGFPPEKELEMTEEDRARLEEMENAEV